MVTDFSIHPVSRTALKVIKDPAVAKSDTSSTQALMFWIFFEVKVDEPEVKVKDAEVKLEEPEVKVDDAKVNVDEPEVNVGDGEVKLNEPEMKVDEPEVDIKSTKKSAEKPIVDAEVKVEDNANVPVFDVNTTGPSIDTTVTLKPEK